MRYEILTELIDELEKKLKPIKKKCAKYGCDFKYEKVEEINKPIKGKYYNFTVVEVEGNAKIDNYELVGIIEQSDNGNIVNAINNCEVPKRFWTTENYCEHCNSKRNRKNLFIIRNTETNEYKQLGKSCVKLYTNGIDAEHFAQILHCYDILKKYNDMYFEDYIDTYNAIASYKVDDVLNLAIMLIDEIGYMNTNDEISTKSLIKYGLRDIKLMNKEINKKAIIEFTKADIDVDRSTKINNIKEYYMNMKADTEYIHNIQVLLSNEYIREDKIGYIAYLPKGYDKYIEQVKKQKALCDVDSIYYGDISKRYKQVDVKQIKDIATYSNDYGIVTVYQIVIDNSILIWKTNKHIELNDINKIDFTVKEHRIYKGINQTIVTRCKLY